MVIPPYFRRVTRELQREIRPPMPQPPKKLRKQHVNNQYPSLILRFEDGHEIVIKRGTGKTFDCYAGENIKLLAVFDPDHRERDLVETKKSDDFPDA